MPHENATARRRKAALTRAIISAAPDYFSWPVEQQERYRASMPPEDNLRIRQTLLSALFGIQAADKSVVDAAFDSFTDEQYLLFNSAMLPLHGIGDDCFFLNECMAENTSLLDFETVYDYDHADHCFQESVRQQEDPGYVAKPYRGALFYRWARLHIDGAFSYANLCLAAGYVNGKLDELGFDQINLLIPHEYVDGKHHGKREGQGYRYDKRVDAGGMEAQLDELRHRYYQYLSERSEVLSIEFDAKAQKRVYRVDASRRNEPCMDFVFTDQIALRAIRFRHFMKDCQAIMGDPHELEALIEREQQTALGYLDRAYQDILNNFDPKVVKLRKKWKIILAEGAAQDLL